MLVDEGIEGQPISPAGGEVAYVNVAVASSLHLAPEQQGILGGLRLTAVCLLYGDVLDLKVDGNMFQVTGAFQAQ